MVVLLVYWVGTVTPLLPWYWLLKARGTDADIGETLVVMALWPVALPYILVRLAIMQSDLKH